MNVVALPLGRQLPATGRLALLLLATALLTSGFGGHAGVQLLDGAMLAKLYPVHRHGVPGEAAYIAAHGTWEGYVHSHCHRQAADAGQQPGPDEVQAAASLAGAVTCAEFTSPLPAPPTARPAGPDVADVAASDVPLLPPTPPPR